MNNTGGSVMSTAMIGKKILGVQNGPRYELPDKAAHNKKNTDTRTYAHVVN